MQLDACMLIRSKFYLKKWKKTKRGFKDFLIRIGLYSYFILFETWVYHYDPETTTTEQYKEWNSSGSPQAKNSLLKNMRIS